MNSSVEEIKARLNIIDLIGEYVRLQKAGANWRACCPFHNEKTPSFMVSEDKQMWKCFGCQKGGDVFGFVMEIEGLEFKEALKLLADKAGVQLQKYNPKETDDKNKILEILELATKFYEKQLWDGAGKEKILKYLNGRGLNNDSIKEFRLGYAPDGWRNALSFLLDKGYLAGDIEKTGLLVKKEGGSNQEAGIMNQGNYYDRFRDRIIFPIADNFGKVVGYSARVAPGGDESQAKYVNTPETPIYHKSKILYGIDKAKQEIKNKNFTLLVEGNTDVMAAHQAGLKNTVAVSGTALTPDQLDILKRYSENIKMLFDMDEPGQQAALKSAQLAFQKELNAYIVELKEGKDAAELAAKDVNKLLQSVEKAVPAMEYFFNKILIKYDKTKAQDKKIIAKELLNIISNLSNEIEKIHWIKRLAKELDVEDKILFDLLNKNKKAERRSFPGDKPKISAAVKKRTEVIREKLIGLMLADSDVWKKISGKNQDRAIAFLKEDDLFSMLLDKAEEAGYKFDNIVSEISDKETSERARSLHLDAKFQADGQQEIKENSSEENLSLAEQYIDSIKQEICKERLRTIEKDLKKAEEGGDKEAVSFLRKEFSEISKELNY